MFIFRPRHTHKPTILGVCLLLGACGGETLPTAPITEAGQSAGAQPTLTQPAAGDTVIADLPAGEWLLTTRDDDSIGVRVNGVTREALLAALGTEFEFYVYGGSSDAIQLQGTFSAPTLPSLLALVIGRQSFAFEFSPRSSLEIGGSPELPTRLVAVHIGDIQQHSDTRGTVDNSENAAQFMGWPDSDQPLELGPGDYARELQARLTRGSEAERVVAVRELRMTPREFNAAVQVYARDTSPAVRMAVIDLLRDEPQFLAKQVLVRGLTDTSDDVAMKSLNALARVRDFSLLPAIEPLVEHANPALRQRAEDIVDSLASSYH